MLMAKEGQAGRRGTINPTIKDVSRRYNRQRAVLIHPKRQQSMGIQSLQIPLPRLQRSVGDPREKKLRLQLQELAAVHSDSRTAMPKPM
jgi:hypothetical protein